jgi:2-methylcitrate dehydratase PrpD
MRTRKVWEVNTDQVDATRKLAGFAANTEFENVPVEVKQNAKRCILDWLGAALAGSLEPTGSIALSVVETEKPGDSTVIGTSTKTSSMNAALINGIFGHTIELDDIHEQSIIHPAAPVLPAALALAERQNVDGRKLITSVIVGYEVEIRIGASINPSHYRFWHTTGTCGTFGAAAAAGKILGLDSTRMLNAIGIAGTQAAGLIEVFGTMSKPLNAGRAARDGVLAALLAEKGYTSSTMILESAKGYCRATAQECEFDEITEDLGRKFKLNETIFKIHASCGHMHGAVDAILFLSKTHDIKPDSVDEIVVGTYPLAIEIVGKNYEPKSPYEARFSLPYCVAVALSYGKLGLEEFTWERLTDQRILNLARKVKVVVDQRYTDARLGCANVLLRTRDGREFSHNVDIPKGYPANPVTKQELQDKFRGLASRVLPSPQVEEIVRTVEDLDKFTEARHLTALLGKRNSNQRLA